MVERRTTRSAVGAELALGALVLGYLHVALVIVICGAAAALVAYVWGFAEIARLGG
ncbi:MAG: hypothetical protein M3Y87_10340 [Myxococcota bacterium]|nr:hypothetical protein [Myxococcota bacterium]